jgi:hypothetical protein
MNNRLNFAKRHPDLCKSIICPEHGEQWDVRHMIDEQGCPVCYDNDMAKIGDPPAHGVND